VPGQVRRFNVVNRTTSDMFVMWDQPSVTNGILSGYQLTLTGNVNHTQHTTQQDAVGDGRLRPRCRHLANRTKHTHRLWFWPISFIVWKHDVIPKTEST